MSVLIKGMGMPENCVKCRFLYGTTTYDDETDRELLIYECILTGQRRRERDFPQSMFELCPLIEIPPHGRLIDADALLEHLGDTEYKGAVKRVLMQAPTIIEAEEEE